jgi:hypothetical protein
MGQVEEKLLGSWKLVSASSIGRNGERNETAYGENPTGLLTYAPNGRVTSLIAYGGRKPLPMNSRPEDQAEAFSTFLAYTGRYSVADEKVTHHIEISSIPNYVGKDLVRTVKFNGNRITLITPPTMVNGKFQSIELTWERLTEGSSAAPTT